MLLLNMKSPFLDDDESVVKVNALYSPFTVETLPQSGEIYQQIFSATVRLPQTNFL